MGIYSFLSHIIPFLNQFLYISFLFYIYNTKMNLVVNNNPIDKHNSLIFLVHYNYLLWKQNNLHKLVVYRLLLYHYRLIFMDLRCYNHNYMYLKDIVLHLLHIPNNNDDMDISCILFLLLSRYLLIKLSSHQKYLVDMDLQKDFQF